MYWNLIFEAVVLILFGILIGIAAGYTWLWIPIQQPNVSVNSFCPHDIINLTCNTSLTSTNIITECPGQFFSMLYHMSEEHTYDISYYNCVNYSNDFVNRLTAVGYNASTVNVILNCTALNCSDSYHMIVRISDIYVEPQIGDVIRPQDYWMYGLK